MNYTMLLGDRDTDGSIKQFVNSANIPSAQILIEAEAWIYQRLRAREMLTEVTGALTIGDVSVALSNFPRYRQPYLFYVPGTTVGIGSSFPSKENLETVIRHYSWDGAGARAQGSITEYAINASAIIFDNAVDRAYPYVFMYYQALEALSGSNETNFLTDQYPTLLRTACMYRANEYRKDEGERLYWKAISEDEVNDLNDSSDKELAALELNIEIV